jgi:hypothetical protein
MPSKKQLQRFYEKCKLVLKPHPEWRLFKVQLRSGAWYTIPNQIRNEEMLKKYLVKLAPINVFSTVCCFLNPLALNDNNFQTARHIYLSDDSFLFIDIDDHDKRTAGRAKITMLQEERYELWHELDSGNGIHQLYFDNGALHYKDPLRRMEYQMRHRENLIQRFKNLNIKFDYKCMTDLTRVSRVIGTPNDGNINKLCRIILSYKGLQRRKPMKEGVSPDTLPLNIQQGDASRLPSPAPIPFLMKFTDSVIHGARDFYVPYLKLNKSKNYMKLLKSVATFYNLGTIYLFESMKHIHALSLKAIHKNKYLKVLRASKASNLSEFIKYEHSWIRVSSLLDKDMRKIEGKLKPIGRLGMFAKGEYSRPHYNMLRLVWGLDLPENLNLIGKKFNPCHLAYRREK